MSRPKEPLRFAGLETAEVTTVIVLTCVRGAGTEIDPIRHVSRYFSLDGDFLAENDTDDAANRLLAWIDGGHDYNASGVDEDGVRREIPESFIDLLREARHEDRAATPHSAARGLRDRLARLEDLHED